MLLLAPFDYRHFCLVPHVPWDATQYKFLSYGLEALVILWAILVWSGSSAPDAAEQS
jgi:hypothetical protein